MNLSWLLPAGKGIPVLMYHRVWPGLNDDLTITPAALRQHLEFLRGEGYHTLPLPEYLSLVSGNGTYPERSVLITFDDGYQNNLTYVYPLLKEFGWQATFFIISNTLHLLREDNDGSLDQKMTLDELRLLDPQVVQLGMHGYEHENFSKIPLSEMRQVILNSIKAFEESGLPFHKVFAYPYGARPGNAADFAGLKQFMKEIGILAAFRIGNKVSKVPAPDLFEIKRIDIKGTDTIDILETKLKKGKLAPF